MNITGAAERLYEEGLQEAGEEDSEVLFNSEGNVGLGARERGLQDAGEGSEGGSAGRRAGGAWRLGGWRRAALAGCALAGACVAVTGWISRKSAAPLKSQGLDSDLLGLATSAEIASLPYVDDATGQKIAKRSNDRAKCVGEVFSAAFQLADISVTAIQAEEDCSYTRKNPPLATTNVETLRNLEGLVGTMQQSASAMSASENKTRQLQAQPRDLQDPPTLEDMSPYVAPRTFQELCVRDIGILIRSSTGATAQLTQAVPNCDPDHYGGLQKKKTKCAQQVLLSVRATSVLAALCSRMVYHCRPQFSKYRKCSGLLEAISWTLAGAARVYSNTVYYCSNMDPRKVVKLTPVVNVARCVGPAFSTMGYIGASGLNFASGRNFYCAAAKDIEASSTTLTSEQKMELGIKRAACARDHLSGIRQLLLAGYRLITLAAGCNRQSLPCQADISRGASALAGTAQGIAQIAEYCYNVPDEVTLDDAAKKKYMTQCAEKSGALVKILSVTISYGIEAASACQVPNYARLRCAASVWRAIAALGALEQEFNVVYNKCRLSEDWYGCGKSMRYTGGNFRIFVLGFSGALLNCPLSPFREEWKATGNFNFPRGFSFP